MLSIIIPTYNRLEILKRCLAAIDLQEGVDFSDVEVLVVDDGGRDGTSEWLAEVESRTSKAEGDQAGFRFALRSWRQENAGQGNARNLGLRHAQGEIVMFLGDDILLQAGALRGHLAVHEHYPEPTVACLGFTTWHPELRVTNFMYFLEHGGHQFAYDKLVQSGKPAVKNADRRDAGHRQPAPDLFWADFWFFYTSNISLKRALVGDLRFEPVYTSYGWEDIDFGYRLQKERGMRIAYDPSIRAWHHHEVTIDGFRKRMVSIANNAKTFHRRFPEVPILPTGFKKLVFRVISLPPVLLLLRGAGAVSSRAERLYFYALSKKYWLEGLR